MSAGWHLRLEPVDRGEEDRQLGHAAPSSCHLLVPHCGQRGGSGTRGIQMCPHRTQVTVGRSTGFGMARNVIHSDGRASTNSCSQRTREVQKVAATPRRPRLPYNRGAGRA